MCPPGTEEMWQGYSMLFLQGNSKAHGQDLGKNYHRWHVFFFNILTFNGVRLLTVADHATTATSAARAKHTEPQERNNILLAAGAYCLVPSGRYTCFFVFCR